MAPISVFRGINKIFVFFNYPGDSRPMTQRVGLFFDTKQGYQRQVAEGTLRYIREQGTITPESLGGQIVHTLARAKFIDSPFWLGHLYLNRKDKAMVDWIVSTANVEPDHRMGVVCPDDEAVGRLGARYLCNQGYKVLSFVENPNTAAFRERRKFFEEEGTRLGAKILPFGKVFGMGIVKNWKQIRIQLATALRQLPPQTGIMACSDNFAMAVLEVALEEKIAIPDDMALLGVDDDWLNLDMLSVPLSSIRLNGEKIGYRAAELLHEALSGRVKFPARVKIPPLRVVERTSTNFARCADAVVATALDRIKDRFQEPLSVDDLSRGSGISRAAFDRRFQAATGKSPYQMLLQQRFREAERLLIDSRTRITEIAEACGFRTVHDFSARFKDRYQMSPLHFRQARTGHSH